MNSIGFLVEVKTINVGLISFAYLVFLMGFSSFSFIALHRKRETILKAAVSETEIVDIKLFNDSKHCQRDNLWRHLLSAYIQAIFIICIIITTIVSINYNFFCRSFMEILG